MLCTDSSALMFKIIQFLRWPFYGAKANKRHVYLSEEFLIWQVTCPPGSMHDARAVSCLRTPILLGVFVFFFDIYLVKSSETSSQKIAKLFSTSGLSYQQASWSTPIYFPLFAIRKQRCKSELRICFALTEYGRAQSVSWATLEMSLPKQRKPESEIIVLFARSRISWLLRILKKQLLGNRYFWVFVQVPSEHLSLPDATHFETGWSL